MFNLRAINKVLKIENFILTIGNDGFLKQYSIQKEHISKTYKISNLPLSSMIIIKNPNYIAVFIEIISNKLDWILG